MVCYETRISALMQSEKKNILRNNIAEGFVVVNNIFQKQYSYD
jgi:hypothetical protein